VKLGSRALGAEGAAAEAEAEGAAEAARKAEADAAKDAFQNGKRMLATAADLEAEVRPLRESERRLDDTMEEKGPFQDAVEELGGRTVEGQPEGSIRAGKLAGELEKIASDTDPNRSQQAKKARSILDALGVSPEQARQLAAIMQRFDGYAAHASAHA
jgi:hypothetical protein